MSRSYTFYVDESGDSGTTNIRSFTSGGASPFMVLGGVLVADDLKSPLTSSLEQIFSDLRVSQLHCKNLNHHKKVFYARTAGGLDLTCFGVVSDKNTLQDYRQIRDQEAFRYYHKCVQYLLEQLCKYIEHEGIDPNLVSVVFEETVALKLQQLRNFILYCIKFPRQEQSKILEILNTSKFLVQEKKDEPLLQYADLVANSLYQCVNKSSANNFIPETRYINELRFKFWANSQSNLINGFGIKPIHNLNSLNLDADVSEFLRTIKNK